MMRLAFRSSGPSVQIRRQLYLPVPTPKQRKRRAGPLSVSLTRWSPKSVAAPTTQIQFRRGPLTFFQTRMGNMPEGQPYEAGIPLPDGSVFELLYLGGHDSQNKLVGGGFQLSSSGAPSWTPTIAGIAVYDTTNKRLWISNADGTWTSWASGGSGSIVVQTNFDFGTWG